MEPKPSNFLHLFHFVCLCLFSLGAQADEGSPQRLHGEITKEEAIAKAQTFLRDTDRDKYWRVNEPTIKLREEGKYEGKIWDISFPSKRVEVEKNDSDSKSELMAKVVRMMPFLMWVLIDTGEMYYNEYRAMNGRIFVIQTPAKIPTE